MMLTRTRLLHRSLLSRAFCAAASEHPPISTERKQKPELPQGFEERTETDRPSYIPWKPTEQLTKRKSYFKRMAFLVELLEKEQVAKINAEQKRPEFDVGDIIELKLRVPENQSKETDFKGLCISKRKKSIRSSFTLRKTWPPSLGVERTFPLYCPTIVEMKVVGHKDFKGRKLYHLRDNLKTTDV